MPNKTETKEIPMKEVIECYVKHHFPQIEGEPKFDHIFDITRGCFWFRIQVPQPPLEKEIMKYKNPHIIIGPGRMCVCGVYNGTLISCGDIIQSWNNKNIVLSENLFEIQDCADELSESPATAIQPLPMAS